MSMIAMNLLHGMQSGKGGAERSVIDSAESLWARCKFWPNDDDIGRSDRCYVVHASALRARGILLHCIVAAKHPCSRRATVSSARAVRSGRKLSTHLAGTNAGYSTVVVL